MMYDDDKGKIKARKLGRKADKTRKVDEARIKPVNDRKRRNNPRFDKIRTLSDAQWHALTQDEQDELTADYME